MRLIVIADQLSYGGRTYRKGEELELPDKEPERTWAIAFQAMNHARRAEPFVIRNPPAPPRAAPAPPSEPAEASWMRPAWEAQEPKSAAEPTPSPESPDSSPESPPDSPSEEHEEHADDGSLFPTTRHRRRYHRRDLKPEE